MASWSGFWGDGSGSTGAYSLYQNKMPRRNAMRGVVNREGFRTFTALFNGLVGAASGSNVTATHTRISNDTSSAAPNGGARTIDTITDINRNTAAADVTALKEMTVGVTRRPTYPRDASGNGGGAY